MLVLVARLLLTLGEIASRIIDAQVAALLTFGEVAAVLLLGSVSILFLTGGEGPVLMCVIVLVVMAVVMVMVMFVVVVVPGHGRISLTVRLDGLSGVQGSA
jgi:hypothetical protein